MPKLTHEKIARLADAVGFAPWKVKDWKDRCPEEVIPVFEKILAVEKELNEMGLPYCLAVCLSPRRRKG